MCNNCKIHECTGCCGNDNPQDINIKELLEQYVILSQQVKSLQEFIGTLSIDNWDATLNYTKGNMVVKLIDGKRFLFRAKKNSKGEEPSISNSTVVNEYWEELNATAVAIVPEEKDPTGVFNITIEDGRAEEEKIITIIKNNKDKVSASLIIPDPDIPSNINYYTELRYSASNTFTAPNPLESDARDPDGWDKQTPAQSPNNYIWQTSAIINEVDDSLVTLWNPPTRVTGTPGIGVDGANGDSVFKSIVFIRSATVPATPTGGTWLNPIPTGWSDGVPSGENALYMSTRVFTLSGQSPQQSVWSTPQLAADSSDLDYEWSSVAVSPGNPTDNPGNWTNIADNNSIWLAIRKKVNGQWGSWDVVKIKGENGLPGKGYDYQYTLTEKGSNPPSITDNSIWTSTFPSSISNTQTLWMRQRIANADGTFGSWVGPVKMTGDDGTGKVGSSLSYRGDYSSVKQYVGNEYIVDVVKYNNLGYMAKTTAGNIPVGTLPTNTTYWTQFTTQIDSLFADYLFAYNGYIQDLTVGSLRTGTSGTRLEIEQAENKLKFYKDSNTDPSLEVGLVEVPSIGIANINATVLGGVRFGANNYVTMTSRGVYCYTNSSNRFNRVSVPGGYNDQTAVGVFISTNPIIYADDILNISVYGTVTNSLRIFKPVGSLDQGIFVGYNTATKKPYQGKTEDIGGMKFIDGIYVGPA